MTHDETCDVPLNCRFLRDEEKRDCLVARPLKRREDRGTDGHVISPVVFYILTYSCLLIYAVLVTALLSNSSCSEHQLRREAHKKEERPGKKRKQRQRKGKKGLVRSDKIHPVGTKTCGSDVYRKNFLARFYTIAYRSMRDVRAEKVKMQI